MLDSANTCPLDPSSPWYHKHVLFLGNISGSEVCPFYCSGRCVCSDLVDFGLEAILVVPTTVLCVFQVWEGQNIVKLARMMLGETNPADSKPGSIRGDLCIDIGR